jgi:hypothetical protein
MEPLPIDEAAAMTGAASPPRRLKLRGWKRVTKGSLIGFANITLPIGDADLEVDDLPLLISSNGKAWATWPGKPVLTKEGTVAKLPGSSKPQYVAILRWRDRETSERFSQALVALVKAADPGAFERQP